MLVVCEFGFIRLIMKLQGAKKPTEEDVALMRENVTFVFKSFERQKMAKQLYKNIQDYYPGIKVIIADDSSKPLDLQDDHLEVIQLPFNSGLSKGLNCALQKVKTPYVIRMDDDELLTPRTNFHDQLRFLMEHPEVDLAAVLYVSAPIFQPLKKTAQVYYNQPMDKAPKKLKIPHMTRLDENHIVVGKPPQIFIARTQAIKSIGYDDKIRMIDHNEFFFRAAGNIVSVIDPTAFVFHRHNDFDRNYSKYRFDISSDLRYIRMKMAQLMQQAQKQ